MSKRTKMVVAEVNLTFEGSHIPAGTPFAVTPDQEKRMAGKVTKYVEPVQAPAPVPDDDGGEVEIPIEDPIPVPDPGLDLDAPVPGQE